MRSCTEFSAPCSCLTVAAAEAAWTGVGTGAGAGPGPAVTAVQTPGSVFTVAAEKQRHHFHEFTFDFPSGFYSVLMNILVDGAGWGTCGGWWWGMDRSYLVPEAGQGRGTPGRQDLRRLQSQLLRGWRRRRQYWRVGLSTQLHTYTRTHTKWINGPLDAE